MDSKIDSIEWDINLILEYLGSFITNDMIKDMTIKEIKDLSSKIKERNEKNEG